MLVDKYVVYYNLIYMFVVLTYQIYFKAKYDRRLNNILYYKLNLSSINDAIGKLISQSTEEQIQYESGIINPLRILQIIFFILLGHNNRSSSLAIILISVFFEIILLITIKQANIITNPVMNFMAYKLGQYLQYPQNGRSRNDIDIVRNLLPRF
jgi:hypothetical protein